MTEVSYGKLHSTRMIHYPGWMPSMMSDQRCFKSSKWARIIGKDKGETDHQKLEGDPNADMREESHWLSKSYPLSKHALASHAALDDLSTTFMDPSRSP